MDGNVAVAHAYLGDLRTVISCDCVVEDLLGEGDDTSVADMPSLAVDGFSGDEGRALVVEGIRDHGQCCLLPVVWRNVSGVCADVGQCDIHHQLRTGPPDPRIVNSCSLFIPYCK